MKTRMVTVIETYTGLVDSSFMRVAVVGNTFVTELRDLAPTRRVAARGRRISRLDE